MFQAPPNSKVNLSAEQKKKKLVYRATPREPRGISLRRKSVRNNSYRTSGRRKKQGPDMDSIQRFFLEFHDKSKILLSELEKNVLKS